MSDFAQFDPKGVKTDLTLDDVKACIGFEPGTVMHTLLSNLCDIHYQIAKRDGATDHDAAVVALDKLGEKLLSFIE